MMNIVLSVNITGILMMVSIGAQTMKMAYVELHTKKYPGSWYINIMDEKCGNVLVVELAWKVLTEFE